MNRTTLPTIFFLLVTGCTMEVPPPHVTYEAVKHAAHVAAADASQIQLLTPDNLPDGFALDRTTVYAEPNQPSSEDPHIVLGEVRVDVNRHHTRETYLLAMKQEAARHGANALVILDETGDTCYSRTEHKCRLGVALHVSSAAPAKFPRSNDVLAVWLKDHASAGKPAGEPRAIDLASPEPFEITPKRGECVTLVLALDESARVRRVNNRPVVSVQTTSRALGFNRSSFIDDDWGTKDRTLALEAGCAQNSEPVTVSVKSRIQGDAAAPGSGKALLQIVTRTVDEKTLQDQAKKLGDAVRRSDQSRAAMAQQACDACIGEWRRCVLANPDIRKGQCGAFNHCVQRHYEDPRGCDTR